MIDLFGSLKAVIKRKETSIDNALFKLHYMFTGLLLIVFSLMVTARQYFGNPIDCVYHSDVPYINTYCWIRSTFSMVSKFHQEIGVDVPYHGIGNSRQGAEERKYYAYYQWVCFVLFFQAILFYVPRFLWKMWEGGLLDTISLGMHVGLMKDEDKNAKKKVLVEYLSRTYRRHTFYALKYFICEALCLVNVIGQMYLMNRFIGGEFFDYGSRVLEFSEMEQNNRTDPMIFVFPRMTKCIFHQFGPSGDIQTIDAFCILPLNIVNEKIYIFLWFWFIILTVLTALLLAYRIFLLAFPKFRPQILHARCRMTPTKTLDAILRNSNVGDWFLFYLLGKNMDPVIYREVCTDFAKKLEASDTNNP